MNITPQTGQLVTESCRILSRILKDTLDNIVLSCPVCSRKRLEIRLFGQDNEQDKQDFTFGRDNRTHTLCIYIGVFLSCPVPVLFLSFYEMG